MFKKKFILLGLAVFFTVVIGYSQDNFKQAAKDAGLNDKTLIENDLRVKLNEETKIQFRKGKEAELMNQFSSIDRAVDVKVGSLTPNREVWNVMFQFSAGDRAQVAVATDGNHFYTATWSSNYSHGFFRYELDGSSPVGFSIPGVPLAIRSLTYDGEYFYAGVASMTIYKLDLVNETLVGTITPFCSGVNSIRHLSYDPTLDGGNGGFWIGDWATLGAVSKTGAQLIPNSATPALENIYGSAFDNKSDPANPVLWLNTHINGVLIRKFDINTLTLTPFVYSLESANLINDKYYGGGICTWENAENGKLVLVANVQANPNLIFGFEIADIAVPESPAAPLNFTITPGAAGALNATITWTNPSTTVNGGTLTSLSAIEIYQNNVLIHTVNNPTVGSTGNYGVNVSVSGFYDYKIVGKNSFGNGALAKVSKWIGIDVPSEPVNLTGTVTGSNSENVLLNWTAPTTGLHGGMFVAANTVYSIVRNPGNVTVASGITATTFTDMNPPGFMLYNYTVTAVNSSGTGGSANVSNIEVVGNLGIPYYMGFEVGERWDLWTIVDANNDNYTWINVNSIPYEGYNCMTYIYNDNWPGKKANDWLFSPLLPFESQYTYIVKFWVRVHNESWTEKMALYLANGITPESVIGEPIWVNTNLDNTNYIQYEVTIGGVSGDFSLAFHCFSQADMWFLYLDNVEIDVVASDITDLSAVSISGNFMPTVDEPAQYKVAVKNTGRSVISASSYDVKLMKVDNGGDITLFTTSGLEINPGFTQFYEFNWTSTTSGSFKLYGEVVYSLDQEPANNRTSDFPVNVIPEVSSDFCVGSGTTMVEQPAYFWYKRSLSQTIYYPEEIGVESGFINALTYNLRVPSNCEYLDNTEYSIWMGITNKTQFANTSDWVDFNTLTHVYTGVIDFTVGGGEPFEVTIVLPEPYLYPGGNLVIYTRKSIKDWTNMGSDRFFGTSTTGVYRTIARYHDLWPLYPDDPGTGIRVASYPNICLSINTSEIAKLEGIVSGPSGIIAGATVQAGKTKSVTNELGEYNLTLRAGKYDIIATANGYLDTVIFDVQIDEDEATTQNITMAIRPTYTISGKVLGNDALSGLANVTVSISGYNNYSVETNATGDYSITGVYDGNTYNLEATLQGYHKYTAKITLSGNNESHDFTMNEILYTVPHIAASLPSVTEQDVNITWGTPGIIVPKKYSFSNDIFYNGWTINPGYDIAIGNLFPIDDSGEITSVELYSYYNVYLEGSEVSERTLTVIVYDENRNFIGASQPFSFARYMSQWITIPMPDIPYSGNFYVMVRWSKESDDDTNFLGVDTSGPHIYDDLAWVIDFDNGEVWESLPTAFGANPSVMGIRVNANSYGQEKITYDFSENDTKGLNGFNVYRFLKGAQKEAGWTLLNNLSGTDRECTDHAAWNLPYGVYRYSVTAMFNGNVEGPANQSKDVPIKMRVPFMVSVSTNDSQPVEGAIINVEYQGVDNPDSYYENTIVSGTLITFPEVWRGLYTITVTLSGYAPYIVNNVDIRQDNTPTYHIILKEQLYPASNVLAIPNLVSHVDISWGAPDGYLPITYQYDDGTYEVGYQPDYYEMLGLGNMFTVGENGKITSVDVYGITCEDNTDRIAYIQIYNAWRELIAQSDKFLIPEDDWVNVPINNAEYDDVFYAIVWWPSMDGQSNWLGYDESKPNPYSMNNVFYNPNYGWYTFHEIMGAESGVFMIRVNADKKDRSTSYGYNPERGNRKRASLEVSNDISFANAVLQTKTSGKAPELAPKSESTRLMLGYNVYRFVEGTPQANWTKIANNITQTSHVDEGNNLTIGNVYYYAVTVIYTDGIESPAKISKKIVWGMYSNVTVAVSTNGDDPVSGGIINFTNNNGDKEYIYQQIIETSPITFYGAFKGTYTLTVTLDGYQTYIRNNDVVNQDEVTLEPVVLIEIIDEPFSLEIIETEDECEHIFTWNNVYDVTVTFEADNIWGNGCGYQMLLDETASLFGDVIPEEGSFAECWDLPEDYSMFSHTIPENAYPACQYADADEDNWVLESNVTVRIPAGVYDWCIVNPEVDDQMYIVEGDGDQMGRRDDYIFEFGYKYYFHVTGNLSDWVEITVEEDGKNRFNTKAFVGYRVYLNGKVMGMTNDTQFTFINAPKGTNTAGVQAVYISGASKIVEYDFISDCDYVPPTYTIEVSSNNDAWGTVTGGGLFTENDPVRLDASEKTGYIFINWTENDNHVTNANPYEFEATANRTLVGNFVEKEPDKYTITFVVKNSVTQENITGATITFNSVTQTGNYVFVNVPKGDYDYIVTAINYHERKENVKIDSDKTITVGLDPLGDIKDNLFSGIVLYPNPFKNEINISNSVFVKNVQITNVAGQKVKDVVFDGKTISTKALANGIYFITIESISGEKTVNKMVKK